MVRFEDVLPIKNLSQTCGTFDIFMFLALWTT